jgi:hypothetical protein
MVVRTCNSSIWEVVVGGWLVQGQTGLHNIARLCLTETVAGDVASSVTEHLPSMSKVLGLIPITMGRKWYFGRI